MNEKLQLMFDTLRHKGELTMHEIEHLRVQNMYDFLHNQNQVSVQMCNGYLGMLEAMSLDLPGKDGLLRLLQQVPQYSEKGFINIPKTVQDQLSYYECLFHQSLAYSTELVENDNDPMDLGEKCAGSNSVPRGGLKPARLFEGNNPTNGQDSFMMPEGDTSVDPPRAPKTPLPARTTTPVAMTATTANSSTNETKAPPIILDAKTPPIFDTVVPLQCPPNPDNKENYNASFNTNQISAKRLANSQLRGDETIEGISSISVHDEADFGGGVASDDHQSTSSGNKEIVTMKQEQPSSSGGTMTQNLKDIVSHYDSSSEEEEDDDEEEAPIGTTYSGLQNTGNISSRSDDKTGDDIMEEKGEEEEEEVATSSPISDNSNTHNSPSPLENTHPDGDNTDFGGGADDDQSTSSGNQDVQDGGTAPVNEAIDDDDPSASNPNQVEATTQSKCRVRFGVVQVLKFRSIMICQQHQVYPAIDGEYFEKEDTSVEAYEEIVALRLKERLANRKTSTYKKFHFEEIKTANDRKEILQSIIPKLNREKVLGDQKKWGNHLKGLRNKWKANSEQDNTATILAAAAAAEEEDSIHRTNRRLKPVYASELGRIVASLEREWEIYLSESACDSVAAATPPQGREPLTREAANAMWREHYIGIASPSSMKEGEPTPGGMEVQPEDATQRPTTAQESARAGRQTRTSQRALDTAPSDLFPNHPGKIVARETGGNFIDEETGRLKSKRLHKRELDKKHLHKRELDKKYGTHTRAERMFFDRTRITKETQIPDWTFNTIWLKIRADTHGYGTCFVLLAGRKRKMRVTKKWLLNDSHYANMKDEQEGGQTVAEALVNAAMASEGRPVHMPEGSLKLHQGQSLNESRGAVAGTSEDCDGISNVDDVKPLDSAGAPAEDPSNRATMESSQQQTRTERKANDSIGDFVASFLLKHKQDDRHFRCFDGSFANVIAAYAASGLPKGHLLGDLPLSILEVGSTTPKDDKFRGKVIAKAAKVAQANGHRIVQARKTDLVRHGKQRLHYPEYHPSRDTSVAAVATVRGRYADGTETASKHTVGLLGGYAFESTFDKPVPYTQVGMDSILKPLGLTFVGFDQVWMILPTDWWRYATEKANNGMVTTASAAQADAMSHADNNESHAKGNKKRPASKEENKLKKKIKKDADNKENHAEGNNKRPASKEEDNPKKKIKEAAPVQLLEQVPAAMPKCNGQLGLDQDVLPIGWEITLDPASKKVFYFHRESGITQWEKPTDQDVLPIGWESTLDPATKKVFYFHRESGKTQWEKPTVESSPKGWRTRAPASSAKCR